MLLECACRSTGCDGVHGRLDRAETVPKRVVTAFNYARSAGFGVTSPKRLLLQALLSGLGDAVRLNDGLAADRYHRRISQIAGHFDTNHKISGALERLHSASSRWLATNVAERYEPEQQVLENIGRVMELL